MQHILFLSFFWIRAVAALPVYVFETQTDDVFVTVGPSDANVFSTQWNDNWQVSTLWPTTSTPTTSQAPAPKTSDPPTSTSVPQEQTTSIVEPGTSETSASSQVSTPETSIPVTPTTSQGPPAQTSSIVKTTSQAPEPATTSTISVASLLSSSSSTLKTSSEDPTPQTSTTSQDPTTPTPTTTSQAPETSTSTPQAPETTSSTTSQAPEATTSTTSPAPAPAPTTSTTSQAPAPTTTTQAPVPTTSTTTQAPAPTTSTTSQAPAPPASTSAAPKPSGHIPNWIVYSPYNDDSSCKDASTVSNDLYYIKSKGIGGVRMYATDCNSLETVQPVAQKIGLKIAQGLWIGTAGLDNVDQSLSDLISWAQSNNGWDLIEHVIIGNEDVNNGYVTANDLIQKAWDVRGRLESAGFTGKLSHADTTNAYLDNTELATSPVFDIVALNAHSFFDPSVTAQQAGSFVQGQQQQVAEKCNTGSKTILITETGYPSKGDSYGLNVPSPENQKDAVYSLISDFNNELVILTTFNDMWKQPGPYGIEQYFGTIDILG